MLLRLPVLLLIAASAFAGDDAEQRKYLKLYETFEVEVYPKLPPFTFRLFQDLETNKFERIEVLQGEDEPRLVQVLDTQAAELPGDRPDYFRNPDLNFDGYADVMLLASPDGSPPLHRVWLYEPGLRSFSLHAKLSELPNLEVHSENHTLTSKSESAGAVAIAVYGFEGEKLVQLEEETRTRLAAACSYLRVLKKRKNGQLALVSQETVSDAGASCKAK